MSSPRRILFVDLAPSVGGSVISLYGLIKGLDRSSYEPRVVLRASNPYASSFRKLGVPLSMLQEHSRASTSVGEGVVSSVRQGRLAQWLKHSPLGERLVHLAGFYMRVYPALLRQARELGEVIRAWRPDLIHLNDIIRVSRAGIMAAKRTGVPAICHLRAMGSRNHYDRWLSRSLRGYICISQAVDRHQRTLGGRIAPSWVVYNGLDLAEIDQAVDAGQVRAELGLTSQDLLIGCVGRLVEWKGQHIFLQALAKLAPSYPRLRGLIVGVPEANTRDYAQGLVELAHELNLDGVVTFAGFRSDVPRLLRALDVTVHPSTSPEPFGRDIIESMAAGTVVVGTDAGAVPEIIEDGVTGMIVPPSDADAMARAIAYVLDHPQEAETWRRAARKNVERRFSLERYVNGVERVYEELLGD